MDLRESSLGFYRAWHIALGVRHGMLLALRDVALAPETLADELGLDEESTRLWCEGAWGLGLVTKSRGRYRLARAHATSLAEPTSPDYLGHHFHYLARKSLTFDALDGMLHGKRAPLDLASTYAIATSYDHVASLAAIPRPLARDLARGIDVLDLGAGHGGWTRAALARFPASRFTAADLDTRPLQALRRQGTKVLDARRLPANAYDLVYLGEVLAATRAPEALLRAAHRALRPGGRLCLVEGLRPDDAPRTWGARLVLAMGLDFATDGSRFLSPRELRAALRQAGFARASLRDLGGSLYFAQTRKPQTPPRR